MPAALDPPNAELTDRYLIEREIGRGGMATVYLAQDVRHRRKVAIKILRPELATSLYVERFLREIEIAANLNHPHILSLIDSGEADGALYYVMPFVEGESLRDRLKREKQLPLDDAVEIASEVADALAFAHARNVVHRDVKPENILLQAGHALVADFGIARAVTEAGGDRITQTGIAIGTPAYLSPEQASGETGVDGRSDVYSLGCVLFEMLAGEPPFSGATVNAIIAKQIGHAPPRLSLLRSTIPLAIENVVQRALAKAPVDRYASARDFSTDLIEAQREPEVHTTPRAVATAATPSAPLATGLDLTDVAEFDPKVRAVMQAGQQAVHAQARAIRARHVWTAAFTVVAATVVITGWQWLTVGSSDSAPLAVDSTITAARPVGIDSFRQVLENAAAHGLIEQDLAQRLIAGVDSAATLVNQATPDYEAAKARLEALHEEMQALEEQRALGPYGLEYIQQLQRVIAELPAR